MNIGAWNLEAGQLLQFVGGHRPGGVLGADGGHLGLAGGAGQDARHAAGLADHLLGQGIPLLRLGPGLTGRVKIVGRLAVPGPCGPCRSGPGR